MIKKISAIVLALVLCLSVVVMPASAYELGSGSKIAYVVELDKANYSAGDTVTVKLYIYGDPDIQYNAGALVFGCHTDAFDQAENAAAAVKASATTGDTASTFYKPFNGQTWAWQTNTTIYNNIVANNTAEENELFDQFIKVAAARHATADATHENGQDSKLGYYGSDFNADSEAGVPFVSFQLKLKDDLADGTVINVGIPEGPMAKNYTYFDTFKTPGTSTTKVKTTAADSEVVFATATIGASGLTVAGLKQQIKPGTAEDGTFSYRVFANLTNFVDIFGDIDGAKGTDDNTYITEAGFIYNKGAAVDEDKALAQINGGEVTYPGDNWQRSAYISSSAVAGKYVMACVVYDIPDASATDTLSVFAYVKYVQGGVEKVAYCDAYTGTFETLYNKYCK